MDQYWFFINFNASLNVNKTYLLQTKTIIVIIITTKNNEDKGCLGMSWRDEVIYAAENVGALKGERT